MTDREEANLRGIVNAKRWRPYAEVQYCMLCRTHFVDHLGCACPKEDA